MIWWITDNILTCQVILLHITRSIGLFCPSQYPEGHAAIMTGIIVGLSRRDHLRRSYTSLDRIDIIFRLRLTWFQCRGRRRTHIYPVGDIVAERTLAQSPLKCEPSHIRSTMESPLIYDEQWINSSSMKDARSFPKDALFLSVGGGFPNPKFLEKNPIIANLTCNKSGSVVIWAGKKHHDCITTSCD